MKGTVKSKADVERLFQRGRRSSSSFLSLIVLENDGMRNGRCAFIAGKKLGSAPFRNRCKRVMREVARGLGAPWPGYDVAFVARRGVATCDWERVLGKTRRMLEELGVTHESL